MSYCFIYNSPDDFANSNRLESRVFFPRIWVCWIKAFQGSRLDLILHITSLQHWPGPYICRWNSDSGLLHVSILLQPSASIPEGPDPSLVRRAVFEWFQHLCLHNLSYVWIVVYHRMKKVSQSRFDMGVFSLKVNGVIIQKQYAISPSNSPCCSNEVLWRY